MTSRIGPQQPMEMPKPTAFEKPMRVDTGAVRSRRPTHRPRTKPDYKGDPLNNPNLDPSTKAMLQAQEAMFRKNQAATAAATAQQNRHKTLMAVLNRSGV